MPTLNPRLTVTLEPSTAAQLRRMSELTGNSQSKIVSELLTQSAPVFDRLIAVLEAAASAQSAAKEETATRLERAQSKIEEQLGIVMDLFDDGARPLLDAAEKIHRRSRGRPQRQRLRDSEDGTGSAEKGAPSRGGKGSARTVSTPPSNRGVRSNHENTKKPTTTRVSGQSAREKKVTPNPTKK